MKKYLAILLFAFVSDHLAAQQNLSDSLSKLNNQELSHYYSVRAKNQKTAATILAACGLVMMTISFASVVEKLENFGYYREPYRKSGNDAAVLGVLGAATAVAALPIMLASKRNRHRAKILLQTSTTRIVPSMQIDQTSVGISIPLGK